MKDSKKNEVAECCTTKCEVLEEWTAPKYNENNPYGDYAMSDFIDEFIDAEKKQEGVVAYDPRSGKRMTPEDRIGILYLQNWRLITGELQHRYFSGVYAGIEMEFLEVSMMHNCKDAILNYAHYQKSLDPKWKFLNKDLNRLFEQL